MAVNIKDVARIAGVSTATVSHVINDTRFVTDATKKNVLEAMAKLDYHPNQVARSLRSQKSRTVGLLIPDISSFYFTGVAEGIEFALRKSGYHMILSNSHESIEDEKDMIKVFNSQIVEGMIIAPAAGNHSYLNNYLRGNCPVVFIDRKPVGFEGDCVVLDNIKSTYDAVNLLISKGHKRIGLVLGSQLISTTVERITGYKMALSENKIDIDEGLIKTGDFKIDSGYQITKDLVAKEKATALFLASDTLAIGAMEYLKENGIQIPEKVAIISCNDFKWTQISTPALTVVSQPSYELGVKAAEVLLSRINNPGKKTKFKDFRLPTKIIVRESC